MSQDETANVSRLSQTPRGNHVAIAARSADSHHQKVTPARRRPPADEFDASWVRGL